MEFHYLFQSGLKPGPTEFLNANPILSLADFADQTDKKSYLNICEIRVICEK